MSRVTENLQGMIKQTLDRNGDKLSLSLGTKVKEGSVVTGSSSENSKRGTPVRSSHSQTAVHQRGNWESSVSIVKLPTRTSHWLNSTRSKRINLESAS